MNMDLIIAALQMLRPGSLWELAGDTYEDLTWKDEVQTKPTKKQITDVIPQLQKQMVITSFTTAIQQKLDSFARTRNYDGIMSACTYATSLIPKFRAEGQYAVEARDNTWAAAYELLAEVEAGTRPMPTLDEVIAALPELVWPQ